MRRRRSHAARVLALLVASLLAAGLAAAAPPRDDEPGTSGRTTKAGLPDAPGVSAKAFIVYDNADEQVLAGSNIHEPRAVASLTKIMTALLVVEKTTGTERVRISARAAALNEGSAIGMRAGQTYPVDTLLNAMLVYSANDAAAALAEYVGGSRARFIGMMNDRARKLGLDDSTFNSETGLDETPATTMSARDVVELARVAMRDRRIQRAVKLPKVTIARPGASSVTFNNRNPFVTKYPGVDGIKTGFTDGAGRCLLVHYSGPQRGNDMYVLLLGERTEQVRDADMDRLLDWVALLRPTAVFAEGGEGIGTVPVEYSTQRVKLFIADDTKASIRVGTKVRERFVVPRLLSAPARAGDEVGRYEVLAGGKVVASSPVLIDRNVRRLTRTERARMLARQWRPAAREGWAELQRQARDLAEYWGLA